ncbi:MAG: pseudouridine synthase [Candidatus Omnitrophica bacterium]|nr:pseudouridine synthase [Candidatus Omnitrophota bacterium]
MKMSGQNMRINVFLARTVSGLSRRKADELILRGRVSINGKVNYDFSVTVKANDTVVLDGETLSLKGYKYLIMNKPAGVITTKADRYAVTTVMDLLPEEYQDVFPVGRLDKETTGLLILTNDGKFADSVMHPKYEVEKEYRAIVRGKVSKEMITIALNGIIDEGEQLAFREFRTVSAGKDKTCCYVTVAEGKKRHVRRVFRQLGFRAITLERLRIGSVILPDDLSYGEFLVVNNLKI